MSPIFRLSRLLPLTLAIVTGLSIGMTETAMAGSKEWRHGGRGHVEFHAGKNVNIPYASGRRTDRYHGKYHGRKWDKRHGYHARKDWRRDYRSGSARTYDSPLIVGPDYSAAGVLLSTGRGYRDHGRKGYGYKEHGYKNHEYGGYGRDHGASHWKYERGHRHHHERRAASPRILHIDRTSVNNIVVGVTAGSVIAGDPVNSAGGVFLQEKCKAGAYCTLRTGPYANSPKIITVNRSGRTIDVEFGAHRGKPIN